ncbi:TetR family transcriptional regulator C-terminal domain-containing protein [Roseibacterium sp. SDUM158017]|uniref:TetR family transcriptional regulator C-terminal domain-containing protein n=1 Tax=Roseicyclus salinarum TaxID=3036773 RepID=UPI002415009E|nr:TetR family transcriptional regulator C-terminal domain-containing protein [Roseibacterium sp. SDUM158017]MDG4650062.1 TetR family transcriptional regulator C-terminal domain-containing protein [Roseibacterium sp. SDUM158017]
MTAQRPKFRRKAATIRKQALVDATIEVVAEAGVRAATVRAIAERAGVTQGLIRHHFSSKEDLVAAAYGHHMARMTDTVWRATGDPADAPGLRLSRFVAAALAPPVMSADWVALWAGFLGETLHDERLGRIHDESYRAFRDLLEHLIGEVRADAGRPADGPERRRLAIAGNAVIDGLWLEGAALQESFGAAEIAAMGIGAIAAILGVALPMPDEIEGTQR